MKTIIVVSLSFAASHFATAQNYGPPSSQKRYYPAQQQQGTQYLQPQYSTRTANSTPQYINRAPQYTYSSQPSYTAAPRYSQPQTTIYQPQYSTHSANSTPQYINRTPQYAYSPQPSNSTTTRYYQPQSQTATTTRQSPNTNNIGTGYQYSQLPAQTIRQPNYQPQYYYNSGPTTNEAWIIQHESGGSTTAKNPKSTAFGIGQLLQSTRNAYAPKGVNPNTTDPNQQLQMMRSYIQDRYGSAANAQKHWEQYGWY